MNQRMKNQLGLVASLLFATSLIGCGSDGADGTDGDDGKNGDDGAKGNDGADGAKGNDGADGTDGDDGADGKGTGSLYFSPVAFPATDEEKRSILASPSVNINGTDHPLTYNTLARGGQVFESGTFGQIVDEDMNAVTGADDSPIISVGADYTSLLPVGDKLFSITHFETVPGGMYLSELAQNTTTGALTVVDTQPIDFSGVHGLWTPCAGSVTPWGAHLGSEEYPPDARAFDGYAALSDIDYAPMLQFYGIDIYAATPPTIEEITAVFNPYMLGYATEVTVAESGSYTVQKHYAMGRMALELAYVMPDEKTAYITDDDTNKGLFMFVADAAGDLSAGTLYAAKWLQTSPNGQPHATADLSWVALGHATDAAIMAMIETDDITFSDIFDTAVPTGTTCPIGFLPSVYGGAGLECLAVKTGMEIAASRLETGRYAAIMGATTEFKKEEGFTFDPYSSTIYVAISDVVNGLLDGDSRDSGGPNDIRIAQNRCGAVFALDVAPSAAIGSSYVAYSMRAVVEGLPKDYTGTGYAGNSCSINGIASPDNVTMMPEYGVLIIGEDTGAHQNDVIWAYDIATTKLTRIQTTPYGSETTSPYWFPNVNGFGYMSSVVQHPYGESDQGLALDASDKQAYVGYIGTFPASN